MEPTTYLFDSFVYISATLLALVCFIAIYILAVVLLDMALTKSVSFKKKHGKAIKKWWFTLKGRFKHGDKK